MLNKIKSKYYTFENKKYCFFCKEYYFFQKCKQSGIKVVLESLQVISAVAFHHFEALLQPHLNLLADVMTEMLQNDHQEVILQAANTVSVIADAILKQGAFF